MKWGIAQINTCCGNIEYNQRKIAAFLDECRKQQINLAIFPELALVGYPPKDFLLQQNFVERAAKSLHELMQSYSDLNFILGSVSQGALVNVLHNSAVLCSRGLASHMAHKSLLPTYDVFDERRYFEPSLQSEVWNMDGFNIGLSVCEDMWSKESVEGHPRYTYHRMDELQAQGCNMMINISASPFYIGKQQIRETLIRSWVKKYVEPFVFVNLVGGNDEILFDGASFVMNGHGEICAKAKAFEEDLVAFDPSNLNEKSAQEPSWSANKNEGLQRALTMGVKDYLQKCGARQAVLGLSGGIDSALVALLAVEALGADNVALLFMPSQYTSKASYEDARHIAKKLKTPYFEIAIDAVKDQFAKSLQDIFCGLPADVTEENIQARIRGVMLMAYANKKKAFLLSTGNKSEMAVGYCTLYGDMAGGLCVISDLFKHEVYELAAHMNQKWKAIPERVFTRAPSAELKPNQKDEDSLPPYAVLDAVLEKYIENFQSEDEIITQGFDAAVVKRIISLVDHSEFKRKQAAPGLKVTAKAFGIGRRMPIARGPKNGS